MDPNIVVPRILLRAIMIIRVMPPSKENVLVKLSHKIEKHRPKHCRTWISAASDSDYSSHVPLHWGGARDLHDTNSIIAGIRQNRKT